VSEAWHVDLVAVHADATESVVVKFVWPGAGPVTVQADDDERRQQYEDLVNDGVGGEDDRVLTLADGLDLLRALAGRFCGSRMYATEPRPGA
jgi:hypothetical protein